MALAPPCVLGSGGWAGDGYGLGLPRDWEPFVSCKRGQETIGFIVVPHPPISLTKLWAPLEGPVRGPATDSVVDWDAKPKKKTLI